VDYINTTKKKEQDKKNRSCSLMKAGVW